MTRPDLTAARSLLHTLDAEPAPPPHVVTVGPALIADLRALLAAHDSNRASLLDERARRQAAQRDAAALRQELADLHRDLGDAVEPWRGSYDDVWGERPDAGRIDARIEGLNDARGRVAAAIARTAKPARDVAQPAGNKGDAEK